METEKERYVLCYHRTDGGHCYIEGITGGYVEMCDNGKYYQNMEKAIEHRIKHIKQLIKEYNLKQKIGRDQNE
jgi:hypothetical protein